MMLKIASRLAGWLAINLRFAISSAASGHARDVHDRWRKLERGNRDSRLGWS